MQTQKKKKIPFSNLESWMHKRIEIPKETKSEFLERWNHMHSIEKIIANILGRYVKRSILIKSSARWHIYKLAMKVIRLFYKIRNDIEIVGTERIPKKGGIFVLNHIVGQDVVVPFIGLMDEPISVFTSMGSGYFSDLMEVGFGWVARRKTGEIMIEKMIRSLLLKNKYIAMWPEGTLERQGEIMQGFSGIVKVYATINTQKNILPFIPIYMNESHGREKIFFKVLKPFFIPREWLRHPEEGGKTSREIIDYVMMKFAQIRRQKKLGINRLLEQRKRKGSKPWN